MCGISGIVDFSGAPVERNALKGMTDAISHRGPDDEGYVFINQANSSYDLYCGDSSPGTIKDKFPNIQNTERTAAGNIALSHRRFSIIDLSDGGHQPLFLEDDSCCVVFNGEIYNYIELREELTSLGVTFKSASDTEVLLRAYKHWGRECFARFSGFWSLALYDFTRGTLIFSRDHLGKKPLYWTRIESRIYFASEIKSLLTIPKIADRRSVNQNAVWNWCVDFKRDLDYETFFEDIHCLPAACSVEVSENFPAGIQTFWSVPDKRLKDSEISVDEAAELLRIKLDDAVRLRLRTDVPLAVELSGGLDSSSIVALAAGHSKSKLTTYTVKFDDPECNEEPWARQVAQMYDVDYRVLEPEMGGFWHRIQKFTHLQEEPYHSPNLNTSHNIWSFMRDEGTKVVLSGAAGDELFAGYGKYFGKAQMDNLFAGRFAEFKNNNQNWTEKSNFNHLLLHEIARLIGLKKAVKAVKNNVASLSKHYLEQSVRPTNRFYTPFLSSWLKEEIVNSQIPYWLRSGEKSNMGMPIEARCPMLDYKVVELAARMPTNYLVRDGWHKWILRKAMEDLLPEDIVWRENKMGFPFPFDRFLVDYKSIIDLIMDKSNNPYIRKDRMYQVRQNWHALSFVLWYEYFINRNFALFSEIEKQVAQIEPNKASGFLPKYLAG